MATGNTIGLYSTVSTPSVSAANTMSLYSGVVNTPITYPYGNANVANFLAVGSDTGGNVVSNIIASGTITGNILDINTATANGNITAANFIGNVFGNVFGNLIVNGPNTGVVFNDDGAANSVSNFTYDKQTGNLFIGGPITATGNVKGNYFLGNGSQLTGLPATYSNAQVAAYLASGTVTSNIQTTANVSAAYFLGNVACASGIYANTIFNGNSNMALATANGNATITVAGAKTWTFDTTGNLNLPIGGDGNSVIKSSANVELVNGLSGKLVWDNTNQLDVPGTVSVTGTVTGALLQTSGTTGNIVGANYISANFFVGDGSLLTNVVSSYGNSNVTNLLANFGSNSISTTGNIDSGNINLTGGAYIGSVVSATGNVRGGNINTNGLITATGNITGNYFLGNGSQLTGLPATYGNSNVATFLSAFGSNTISTTGNVTFGNITDTGSASVTGNISAGNVLTGGLVSATGNITGNYILGNGSQLTGLPATYGNSNVTTLLAAFGSNTISTTGNATFGNITDTGSASVTGNVTGGNLIAVANLTSTQQTIIGTGAYVGNTAAGNGNIIISGRNIATDIPYDPGNLISGNSTISGAVANGRIVIGTGVYGNTSAAMDINGGRGGRLLVMDAYDVPVTTQPTIARGFLSQMYPVLTGNVTLTSTRLLAGGGQILISGGPAGNTYNVGTPLGLAGLGSQVSIGAASGTIANLYPMLGNTSVGHAAGILSSIAVNNGNGVTGNSTLGNAFGTYNQLNMLAGGLANNWFGMASAVSVAPTANGVGNVFGVYNPNNVATYGISNANNARAALNYYFLRNDDAVAQNQLGSLRSYTNFNYVAGNTSGAITIDKTNGQVQRINLTGNISSMTFANFVSSATDSVNQDQQEDIVRVYLNQGATGNFGVTMPTGNAAIKYASGNSTVAVTANTVTKLEIAALTLNGNATSAGTTTYLVTISPAYS